MKKFKFTLEAVHNVREMRQEREEMILSELQAEVNRAAARVEEMEKARHEAIENYAKKLKKGEPINPFEMQLNTNHLNSLDRSIREAYAAVEEKKQTCARQSQIVAAAGRDVKITERLRENQQSRYRVELERSEQTALDELVSANYARKMMTVK